MLENERRGAYSPARGTRINCTCHSPLWSSSGAGWSECVRVSLCVRAAALPQTLLHLSSLSPAHRAVRQTSCATLLSVTLAAISLSPSRSPLDMLSLQRRGYYPCHWRRKRGISLLLPWRSCRMPELLLQVNRRLKRAEMKRRRAG